MSAKSTKYTMETVVRVQVKKFLGRDAFDGQLVTFRLYEDGDVSMIVRDDAGRMRGVDIYSPDGGQFISDKVTVLPNNYLDECRQVALDYEKTLKEVQRVVEQNTTEEQTAIQSLVFPQRVLSKVDAVVRDLSFTGDPRLLQIATKEAILRVLSNEVGFLVAKLEEVRSEACCCHMDHGSDCHCEAGWLAGDALEQWRERGENR